MSRLLTQGKEKFTPTDLLASGLSPHADPASSGVDAPSLL